MIRLDAPSSTECSICRTIHKRLGARSKNYDSETAATELGANENAEKIEGDFREACRNLQPNTVDLLTTLTLRSDPKTVQGNHSLIKL